MSSRDGVMTRRRRIRRDVEEALIRLDVASLAGGGYLATSPDVPGLVAEGRTLTETAEIAQDVARKILESCVEHGDPLPPAFRRRTSRSPALTVPVGLPAPR
jgi:predicted RNase H-like HicB family nuclease